jgi:hypothetical protein
VVTSVPAPPAGGAVDLQVTALRPTGKPTSWTWTAPTVGHIDTWPMGITTGWTGVPEETVGLSNGVAWTKQDPGGGATDTTTEGLSGYLPAGQIRYFNPAGQPETAIIDGDQFETLTSSGSIDATGEDQGDTCATTGECTVSSSIVVMGLGGTPQLQDHIEGTTILGMTCEGTTALSVTACDSDNLLPNGDLVPLGGDTVLTKNGKITQTGSGQLFRLTIVPDPGTPPGLQYLNKYGAPANDLRTGPPNGGLLAGQTISITDPSPNPLGFTTTYKWQIETKCPYDAGKPPKEIEGVPVCGTTPTYTSVTGLPADEQDITSCKSPPACVYSNPTDWTETADFHGDPVATITGPSLTWTWPAAGTFHVRLTTTDQYGKVNVSDETVHVSATSGPIDALSVSAASGVQPTFAYPSVFTPVLSGDAVTVHGCLTSPDDVGTAAYTTPKVTVTWGDGSPADTGTAGANTDPNLVFTEDPGGGCGGLWGFTATHTYTQSPTVTALFVQRAVAITVTDVTDPPTPATGIPPGTSPTSTSATVYANVYPPRTPPRFLSGGSKTLSVAAGHVLNYTGHLSSFPAATLGKSNATGVTQTGVACHPGLPGGVGIVLRANNTFMITGAANVNTPGCYALTVTAYNTNGTSTERIVLDENRAAGFTSTTKVSVKAGTKETFEFTTTGFPRAALSVSKVSCSPGCGSALPADLSFTDHGNGTASLSSHTAALAVGDTGTYTLTVTATNSAGTTTQTFTLVIGGKPRFTSSAVTGFTTQEDATFTITTAGYPAAEITCTVTLSGTERTCLLGGYSRVDGTDFAPPYYGLYFSTAGGGTATLGGAPYHSGKYVVTLTATNTLGSAKQTLVLYVSNTGGTLLTFVHSGNVVTYTPPHTIVPAAAFAEFTVGQAGTVTICSDNPTDVISSEEALPNGLTITNGAGSGCPTGDESSTVSGTPTVPLQADSNGSAGYRIVDASHGLALLTLELVGTPVITSPSTATFTKGVTGSFTIIQGTFSNGGSTFGCFTHGTLPAWMTFTTHSDNEATISGTPLAGGETTITVSATQCGGTSATQALVVDVYAPPTFTGPSTFGGGVGRASTFLVSTGAGDFPTPALSVVGDLPAGVTFHDNGNGTGTLHVSSNALATTVAETLTFEATSAAGQATETVSLAVGTAPAITAPATATSSVVFAKGAHASYKITTSGAPIPTVTCTVTGHPCGPGELPTGLTFTTGATGTATISGTPTTDGTTKVTLTAANGVGTSATADLDVEVETAPAFAGTSGAGSCTAPSVTTSTTMVVGTSTPWTLCATGTPVPALTLGQVTCGTTPVSLPTGLTFTDNGNGSATLAGAPASGTGLACPEGYTVTLSIANGAATVSKRLTVHIAEAIVPTSPATAPTFVAGGPNTFTLTASAVPPPTIAFTTDPPPSWLTLVPHANGSAALTGTPPTSTAGKTVGLTIKETNGTAKKVVEHITIPVSPNPLTAASPPSGLIGEPYSYTFTTAAPATFAVATGSTLPPGLTLSPNGVLSGTPVTFGRHPFQLAVTTDGKTATTSSINFVVNAGHHALEITRFRSFGPGGYGDWFVEVYNATTTTLPLGGWDVGVQPYGSTTPVFVPFTPSTIAPGGTAVIAGPAFSLAATFPLSAIGPARLAVPGGFELVAPDGIVTDVAGETGAPAALHAGRGATFPSTITVSDEDAFVRIGAAGGSPVDTDTNAADFTYGSALYGSSRGYRLVGSDGGIFSFGGAPFEGSMGGMPLNAPVVGMAPTPTGNGYWEVAADGGIFAFGNAAFYGSMGGKPLNQPIVGIAGTPTGHGYWEVAADGGIFAFGNADFYGSMGGMPLNKPIVGIATTPTGHGYWEVASDGGIFSFGAATFYGSTGSLTLNKPVVGMAAAPGGHGYWLVASDGGIFAFGTAPFYGSTGNLTLAQPVVAVAATADGRGYWMAGRDGGVFAFGDAPSDGSLPGEGVAVSNVVGLAGG